MPTLNLKTTHKPVRAYYDALHQLELINISHEAAVRAAFQSLLDHCSRQFDWTLVLEWEVRRPKLRPVRVDGALVDSFRLTHGFWEAKDRQDDLEKEVKKKFSVGYPRDNILFQAPERAILWQDGRQVADEDIGKPEVLVEVLKRFFGYQPPAYQEWDVAVSEFSEKVPELAHALVSLIEKERKTNSRFIEALAAFAQLCRQSINPNLSDPAVEEMLIQHLLTERILRTIFSNPDFARRNVIAAEIEKVIDALTSQSFSRDGFLKNLDRFYKAIETTAATIEDFSQKQHFLNAVYERFFQGFSVKVADTHGIVYTPQPIVSFMIKSVEEILEEEFGTSLGDRDVHILDPFVGTGNFIVRCMQEMNKTSLPFKYKKELHCNEVMLLPYYIASMNIEHEYFDLTGGYEPFEGMCLVDTFELAEEGQRTFGFMTAENTARVERQKQSPIFVILGNPPYNVGQLNENDNNKNRKYRTIDRRVSQTYAKDSNSSSVSKLNDPYVKAIRWASDRLEDQGIIAFVTNSSFADQAAYDGMRQHLERDFDCIYILDLGGNVRRNPKISGTTHNVFGIQIGVSINILVRRNGPRSQTGAVIRYASTGEQWRKEQKYDFLRESGAISGIQWRTMIPNAAHAWLTEAEDTTFGSLIPLGDKSTKAGSGEGRAIFTTYSMGVNSNRDSWVYNFSTKQLFDNTRRLARTYNSEVKRWLSREERSLTLANGGLDRFVISDETQIKWSSRLKECLNRGLLAVHSREKIRTALYRPFCKQHLYFDDVLIHRRGHFHNIFPTITSEKENLALCVTGSAAERPFMTLISNRISDLHLTGAGSGAQCFPYYTYDANGKNRRENITDWALERFREQYSSSSLEKWAIFYYVYAVLHHPEYQHKYAANLKRELPRVPFAPNFLEFAEAGERLADIHVNYESQVEYPLERIESPGKPLNWHVDRMRLSQDRTSIFYNDFLTLGGVPTEAFEYRLGNRSALEWVIDQYQVSTNERSGIVNDPNQADDPECISRLVGQVITVSLETVNIVRALPPLF